MLFIKNWMTNLVTFIILVTFLEIILPNGNMRRFVNMVIGILIILVMVNPLINLLKGNIDIEKEVFANIEEQDKYKLKEDEGFKVTQDKQVIDVYKKQIEREIKNSLISKSLYNLEKVHIQIEERKESKDYGSVKKIDITISNNNEIKKEMNNKINKNIEIKDIKVDIEIKGKVENKDNLNNEKPGKEHLKDIEEIKKDISKQLQIPQDKIFINLKTIN